MSVGGKVELIKKLTTVRLQAFGANEEFKEHVTPIRRPDSA
jgi:hypothetical protein